MGKRSVDEVRKRIAKRKAEQMKVQKPQWEEIDHHLPKQDFQEFIDPVVVEDVRAVEHPLFRKEVFIFKTLCAIIFVLVVGIIFKNPSSTLQPARNVMTHAMGQEFQFATISKWYEGQFGKPLTLLPSSTAGKKVANTDYAVPASGKVLQNFKVNGKGVLVQTNINAPVNAVDEGLTIFVGQKQDLGNTIIIQHPDGTESWYGNLAELSVPLYGYVKKQQKIATVQNSQDGKVGNFYFAFKKGETFIDPIEVISFD